MLMASLVTVSASLYMSVEDDSLMNGAVIQYYVHTTSLYYSQDPV